MPILFLTRIEDILIKKLNINASNLYFKCKKAIKSNDLNIKVKKMNTLRQSNKKFFHLSYIKVHKGKGKLLSSFFKSFKGTNEHFFFISVYI